MNTILTASNMLIGVITIPYITRTLSVEGYGNVTFAQNISQWLSALCLVGIPTYGVRECARARDDPRKLASVVRELLAIITVCTLTVLACFALAIAFVFTTLSTYMRFKELELRYARLARAVALQTARTPDH